MGRYEGWSNRATWNVVLWLNNDYNRYERKRQFVRTAKATGILNEENVKAFCSGEFGERTPDGDKLANVVWSEVLEEFKEEE